MLWEKKIRNLYGNERGSKKRKEKIEEEMVGCDWMWFEDCQFVGRLCGTSGQVKP